MVSRRQLAAIMFTDIEGYTKLMQQNEEKAVDTRNKHRSIFNSITEKHKGRILQYYGDGTLSIFDSAIDAVKCGIEMQLGFQKDPIIPVRIGIHTGDIIFSEEEIIGDGVNVASRIESLSVPGSVFISDKVYDEIKNQESIQTSVLKKFKLKNVKKPIEVYAVSNIGLIVPNSEDIKGKTEPIISESADKQDQPKSISEPILATKLYISPPRTKIVQRPRLIEQLNQGIHRKLTLISAAAGFGKTTLVSDWVTSLERPIAWLSLDKADNDPIRFLTYLIASLQKISENIGEGVLATLQSPQPPPTESLVATILNEITAIPDNLILVLDDYHVVNEKPVNTILNFVLDHQPLNMHLAITTREDPDISLARLRVRDQMTELRVNDLRFTNSEAAGFLNQVMGLKLSVEDIAALEIRTEGWVAGLQLAALSMRGHHDVSGFIRSFAGDDRYILDYLLEEVLQSQSEPVRNFLLQTSILDRLSGPLCDALTGGKYGGKMLQTLDRANLFVVPLDDKRTWYRYHHLFAEMLKTRYMEEEPEQVQELHKRASDWYEKNKLPAESIHHSLSAQDFERAANLIELAWPAMDRDCLLATWLGWTEELPEELLDTRPVLILGYVWALLTRGNLEIANDQLQKLDRLMGNDTGLNKSTENTSGELIVVDKEQFRFLPASMANARAYIAQSRGELENTVKYAQEALDLLPESAFYERGIPAALMGFAHWVKGDLEATFQSFTNVSNSFRKGGNVSFTIGVTFILADIRLVQGRLQEAFDIYQQSLQLAKSMGNPLPVGTEDLYRGISEIHLEQDHKDVAMEFLRKSEDLGRKTISTDWKYRLRLAQARQKEVQGDTDGALDLLDEAQQLIFRSPLPDFRPVTALKARVWIKQGNLKKVLGWVQQQKLSFDDKLSYLQEFVYITLARALIAQYRIDNEHQIIDRATQLLDRLLKTAEEGDRIGNILEILILQAIVQEAKGNISSGLRPLQGALIIGGKEGYVRSFIDEGLPMANLLTEAIAKGIETDYSNKLLDCLRLDKMSKSK